MCNQLSTRNYAPCISSADASNIFLSSAEFKSLKPVGNKIIVTYQVSSISNPVSGCETSLIEIYFLPMRLDIRNIHSFGMICPRFKYQL